MTVVDAVHDAAVIRYPGRLIRRGDGDAAIVRALQARLNQAGCGPIDESGRFDVATERAVKLFQARFDDITG